MKKISEITLLNFGSLLCLIAFPLLYSGVHNSNNSMLMLGMALICVASILPIYAAYTHKNKK